MPTNPPTRIVTTTPTAAPTPEPAPTGVPVLLLIHGPQALLEALSSSELSCIGREPEILARTLAEPGTAPMEERRRLIGCLQDQALTRFFLGLFLLHREPLSAETSGCIREALEVIGPREVLTAGIMEDSANAWPESRLATPSPWPA